VSAKLPTTKEIAKRLNVFKFTVSRALHEHPSMGLRTKMRVQELGKELNYAGINFWQTTAGRK
jgi:LacI family transcriptional regulator